MEIDSFLKTRGIKMTFISKKKDFIKVVKRMGVDPYG
jgi:hypothetical protein